MKYMYQEGMGIWTRRIEGALLERMFNPERVVHCEETDNAPKRMPTPVALYLGAEESLDFSRTFGWENEINFFGNQVRIYRVKEKTHFYLQCK